MIESGKHLSNYFIGKTFSVILPLAEETIFDVLLLPATNADSKLHEIMSRKTKTHSFQHTITICSTNLKKDSWKKVINWSQKKLDENVHKNAKSVKIDAVT